MLPEPMLGCLTCLTLAMMQRRDTDLVPGGCQQDFSDLWVHDSIPKVRGLISPI